MTESELVQLFEQMHAARKGREGLHVRVTPALERLIYGKATADLLAGLRAQGFKASYAP
jgi:hypothetical protein